MSPNEVEKWVPDPDEILGTIHPLRGERVMLDEDLARLYGVETRILNQAVRRHQGRFPGDFMFQLREDEWDRLRSQFVISNEGRGGRRYPPFAFTEQGVAMLSSVLNSERAIAVNVEIMRAFVRYRRFIASNADLSAKIRDLERRFEGKLSEQDHHVRMLFEALRQLRDEVRKPAAPPPAPKRRIGFHTDDEADQGKTKAKKR